MFVFSWRRPELRLVAGLRGGGVRRVVEFDPTCACRRLGGVLHPADAGVGHNTHLSSGVQLVAGTEMTICFQQLELVVALNG